MQQEEKVTIKETNKKGRWADKQYSKQLIEYTNQTLREDEKRVYDEFFNALVEKYKLDRPNDLMLVDTLCFDFIRIKRIQMRIAQDGDFQTFVTRSGTKITKASDASYLLNAVESQFRQTMKELMLTRKEETKKQLGLGGKDFSTFISEIVDADYVLEEDTNEFRRVQKTDRQRGSRDSEKDVKSGVVHQRSGESVQPSNDTVSKGVAGTSSTKEKT